MVNPHFFPAIEPFVSGTIRVDSEHEIYWEESGNPEGVPVLFVHGGPGAGCSSSDRRFFDPEVFRVVLVDQRGCGRSRPLGSIENNTPEHLIADFEAVRQARQIDTWHVFGGSWGSTLAMLYAHACPAVTRSLVLRGIWMLRAAELHWWLYEIGQIQPELWRAFAEFLPEEERGDLLEGYWRRLNGADREVAQAAARAWSIYEGSCCTLLPNEEFSAAFGEDEMSWSLARLEAHYFRLAADLPDDLLLRQAADLRGIPAFAVHGRYDIVCPVKNLVDLADAWPELDHEIIPDAGHSSHEPGITAALVGAMGRIAATGSPVRG